jgi:hypothetical protein
MSSYPEAPAQAKRQRLAGASTRTRFALIGLALLAPAA